MPYYFKKRSVTIKNKAKKDYYLKCTGQKQTDDFEKKNWR